MFQVQIFKKIENYKSTRVLFSSVRNSVWHAAVVEATPSRGHTEKGV